MNDGRRVKVQRTYAPQLATLLRRRRPGTEAASRTFLRASLALVTLLVLFPFHHSPAQQRLNWRMVFWQEDFTSFDSTRYVVGRDASYDPVNRYFRLTPEKTGMAGRLYYVRTFSPSFFETTFRIHLGYNGAPNRGGADGIIFAIAPQVNYPPVDGGSMDFDGSEGVGVEFDTYYNVPNNDPSKEHIAVIGPLVKNHQAANTNVAGKLLTGGWHDGKIAMRNGRVDVTLDGVIYLSYTIPNFPSAERYFGFTSGTGAAFNQHLLDDIRMVVPASSALRFPTMDLCEKSSIDTTLLVVNNTILPLLLTSASFEDILDPGAFEVLSFSPVTLNAGDSLLVRIRLRAPRPGDKLSILKLTASDGETLRDTLRAVVTAPAAEFLPDTAAFPPTHVGLSSEQSIVLRNGGTSPLTISSGAFSGTFGSRFLLLRPAFPFTLQPGETIELRIRFEPRSDSLHTADLRLTSPCIPIAPIPCSGMGVIRTLRLDMAIDTALRPFSKIMLPVRLLDSPDGTGITSFSADVAYNPVVFRLNPLLTAGTISAGAQVTTSIPQPGTYRIQARFPDTLRVAGPLFTLQFESIASDTGCSWTGFNRFDFNYLSFFPGVPRASANSGWICVSPSCRTPEGFVPVTRSPNRILQIAPNPCNPGTRIYLDLPDAQEGLTIHPVSLRLYDLLGRHAATIYEGELTSGKHVIFFDSNALGAGRYLMVFRSSGTEISEAVTVVK